MLGVSITSPTLFAEDRTNSSTDTSTHHRLHFKDNGAALVNPGMGWTLHYYSNIITNYGSRLAPSDTLDDFPGLSVIYLRVPWSFLEPEEGKFDWSLLDTPAQRWIDKGKQIALRITCCESWMRNATPKWVEDAGARGNRFTVGKGLDPNGPYWEPDYNDPVFHAKLDKFLAAMARRYDGNPNVAFIDVGSYGIWGEGHTGSSTKLIVDEAVKIKHIDLHLKHFKKTLLAVSDDFIGTGKRLSRHPITDYMFGKGVTIRDDSICVRPPPRSWYHAKLAGKFWKTLPVILEHAHYGTSVERKAWKDGTLLLRAVEEYHASYMSIHWWPREYLEKNRKAIDAVNKRMGYRIQLREASWPKQVKLGEPLELKTVWANAGVAPCLPGGYPTLTLKDSKGGIVSVHVDENFDVRNLQVAEPEKAPTKTRLFTLRIAPEYQDSTLRPGRENRFSMNIAPGEYEAFISVSGLDGTPKIALPLIGDDGHHRYPLGQIKVTARD
ncbi:MAG: DUF4832 domain-containing protein [Pirellulales bacterium]|nr:DUF4832 domain-containing protein [Pirellulales bacterium]